MLVVCYFSWGYLCTLWKSMIEENNMKCSDIVTKGATLTYWGSVCFNFSSFLWISFWEIQKLDDPKNEKLMKRCFQLLVFGGIQFFNLSKANEKITKSRKQKPLDRCYASSWGRCTGHYDAITVYFRKNEVCMLAISFFSMLGKWEWCPKPRMVTS
jgi:hypothetical protein